MMDNLNGYSLSGSVNNVNSTARSVRSNQTNSDYSNDISAPRTTDSVSAPKQPMTVQLMLQNGRAIAEFIIDDVDELMGSKNVFTGRMVGES